jgi:mRNA interferase MazF
LVKRGEIYYYKAGGDGHVQRGARPVLVIQNDKGNTYSPTTIVAAITSVKKKEYLPTHVSFECDGLPKESTILAEQIFTVTVSDLYGYRGRIEEATMLYVNEAIRVSLGL